MRAGAADGWCLGGSAVATLEPAAAPPVRTLVTSVVLEKSQHNTATLESQKEPAVAVEPDHMESDAQGPCKPARFKSQCDIGEPVGSAVLLAASFLGGHPRIETTNVKANISVDNLQNQNMCLER